MNQPDEIIIPIEFDPLTNHYALELPVENSKFMMSIRRISLEGIWRFFDDSCDPEDISKHNVVFWKATQHGHSVEWRLSGDVFMKIAKTKIIDKRTRYNRTFTYGENSGVNKHYDPGSTSDTEGYNPMLGDDSDKSSSSGKDGYHPDLFSTYDEG